MPKVHKEKIPNPLCPVVSQCGSFTTLISTWLDTKLQPLKHNLPSYLKNNTHLLDIIDKLQQLPTIAKIITTGAMSMYTNINTTDGTNIISDDI